ncbi:MAG TPA: hypothetical protein VF273_04900 [Pelobium sp.]
MRKFLIKSLVFLLLISTVVFGFSITFKRKYDLKTDYLATLIDKEARLNSLDSNRLILVGGSNLAFGVNSAMIENALPLKVANLGLHAGLSLTFMINEASSLMKKGDIVVLNPEYPLYLDSFDPDIDLIQFANELYPASKAYYHFSVEEMLKGRYEKFKKFFQPDPFKVDSVFNREGFNKYGDNIRHLTRKPLAHLIDRKPINPIEVTKAVALLEKFSEKCQQKGVKVFITYPPYPKSEYVGKNKARIDALDVQLRQKTTAINFIDKPSDYVFPDSLFYDTIYHLNKYGREIRTKMLIEDLRSHLK